MCSPVISENEKNINVVMDAEFSNDSSGSAG
jgi:hypothetical protein